MGHGRTGEDTYHLSTVYHGDLFYPLLTEQLTYVLQRGINTDRNGVSGADFQDISIHNGVQLLLKFRIRIPEVVHKPGGTVYHGGLTVIGVEVADYIPIAEITYHGAGFVDDWSTAD